MFRILLLLFIISTSHGRTLTELVSFIGQKYNDASLKKLEAEPYRSFDAGKDSLYYYTTYKGEFIEVGTGMFMKDSEFLYKERDKVKEQLTKEFGPMMDDDYYDRWSVNDSIEAELKIYPEYGGYWTLAVIIRNPAKKKEKSEAFRNRFFKNPPKVQPLPPEYFDVLKNGGGLKASPGTPKLQKREETP